MSKTLKTLVACLIALAIVVVAYFGVTAALSDVGENVTSNVSSNTVVSSETSEESTLYMYTYDVDSFATATVKSVGTGTYTITRGDTDAGEPDYVVDTLAQIESSRIDNSSIKSTVKRLCAYPYKSIVATGMSNEELAENYGFDFENPYAEAEIVFDEGSVLHMVLSATMPASNQYYCKIDSDDNLYIIASGVYATFLEGSVTFIGTSMFYCVQDYRTGIDNIELVNADEEYPLRLNKITSGTHSALALQSTYCVSYPTMMAVDDKKLDTGLDEMCSFAASAAADFYNAETAALYGLDNPYLTLTFTYQKPMSNVDVNTNPVSDYRFYFSAPNSEGICYMTDKNRLVIYAVYYDAYSFLDWKLGNMAGSTFLSPLIKYVEQIDVTVDDKLYTFKLTAGDGSISAVTYNGQQLDVANFKKFYQVILGTGRIGMGVADADTPTYLTIRFKYLSSLGQSDEVLEFKPYSVTQYTIEVNGTSAFTVTKMRVEKIVSDLGKVIRGETVVAYMN